MREADSMRAAIVEMDLAIDRALARVRGPALDGIVYRLSSAAEHPYGSVQSGSRYQGQRGPTASRSFQNFHRTVV